MVAKKVARRIWGISVLVAVMIGAVGTAYAVPTREEVYRNDNLGLLVFKDSDNPGIFWHLPLIKLFTDANGKAKLRKRERKDGKFDYTLFVVPYMTDELATFLSQEIPGVQNRQQLKPVFAKKFKLQVKAFNVLAESDDVTDYHYLNSPQMIRLTLDADQAADFDDLYSAAPGVPANMVIHYDAERVEKYLKIELSYKEVYDAMGIGASGRYTFLKAEIMENVSNFLANKYLTIKSKGDLKIPPIVERVIAECFTPSQRTAAGTPGRPTTYPPYGNSNGYGSYGQPYGQSPSGYGYGYGISHFGSSDAPTADPREQARRIEESLHEQALSIDPYPQNGNPGPGLSIPTPVPSGPTGPSIPTAPPGGNGGPTPLPPGPGPGTSPVPYPGGGNNYPPTYPPTYPNPIPQNPNATPGVGLDGLQFTFRKDLAERNEKFLFDQQEMADHNEIAVLPIFLMENPQSTVTREVIPLGTRQLTVGSSATVTSAASANVVIHNGEQWTINSAFSFLSQSPYGSGTTSYRWDTQWGSPYDYLYYRIGSGAWRKVGMRTLLGGDVLEDGALEFYVDKAAIWNLLPADLREAKVLGLYPAIFPFSSFYPEFHVTVSGKKVTLH